MYTNIAIKSNSNLIVYSLYYTKYKYTILYFKKSMTDDFNDDVMMLAKRLARLRILLWCGVHQHECGIPGIAKININ